jgi:hypothetical protein
MDSLHWHILKHDKGLDVSNCFRQGCIAVLLFPGLFPAMGIQSLRRKRSRCYGAGVLLIVYLCVFLEIGSRLHLVTEEYVSLQKSFPGTCKKYGQDMTIVKK